MRLFPAQDGADVFKRNHRKRAVEGGEAATCEVCEYVGVKLAKLKFRQVFEFFFRDNKHFLLLSF